MNIENTELWLKNFRPELKTAFVCMIMGRNVYVTDEKMNELRLQNPSKFFHIVNIDEDERITIVNHGTNNKHFVTCKDLKFSDNG